MQARINQDSKFYPAILSRTARDGISMRTGVVEERACLKVLILGGTRFVGRRLVHRLIAEGHDVTIATRGTTPDPFGYHIERLTVHREDTAGLKAALFEDSFDVVYDQLCANPRQAQAAIEALGNRVKRYIFTSSMMVYNDKYGIIDETDFDPSIYPIDLSLADYAYAEGKRQAEAYFFQHAPFPVVAIRPGMIIAEDDYTGRFDFVIDHVTNGIPLGVHLESRPISFISADSMAHFLNYIGIYSDYVGPLNACDEGYYTGQDMAEAIGQTMGIVPRTYYTEERAEDPNFNPYAFESMLKLSTRVAESIGFTFPNMRGQLPPMVEQSLMREAEF